MSDPSTSLSRVQAHVAALLGEDDPEFVADLIETFGATARQAVAEAEQAAAGGDPATLAAAAHTLKGSASNIGLEDLAGRWDTVESAARQGDHPASALATAVAETRATAADLAGAV